MAPVPVCQMAPVAYCCTSVNDISRQEDACTDVKSTTC